MSLPDNYDLFVAHDAEQERKLEQLPICCECDEPIQSDHYYEINDEPICPDCIESNHRKWVDDYVS